MKKIFSYLIVFVLAFACCSYFICDPVHAKKKGGNKSSSGGGGLALKLKARDGGTVVFGSVLNPKENEMKAKLPKKALRAIQDAGIDDLSIQITQLVKGEGDTSNIYTLNPSDSVDVFGKFLVINLLASLTDVAGSTYTAGALPEGKYDVTITAGDLTISGQFDYKPPVVVVGNVSSDAGCSGGTQQVTDLGGDPLGRTVALSNCSYFNEVQANRTTETTKSRKLLHQESSEEEVADAPVEDTTTEESVEESEIAISEAIVTTDEGTIEELSAPIELNPDLNGEVQFDINENTTDIVNNALGFVGDDIEFAKEVLKDEVKATSIEEIEGAINDIGDGDDAEFDPSCAGKFVAKLDEVSDNPSASELLEFGRKLIDSFTNGDLVGCTPSFIQKIINLVNSKGDDGLIAFAKQFIFHVEEMENEFEGGGPNPERICQELERGLSFLKECKGRFCPPPPCFPEGLRNVLGMTCPSVLALVPEAKCEAGPRACGLRPNPGFGPGPGGFGPGGPGGPGFGGDPFGGPGGPGFGGDPFGGPGGPGFGSTGFNGDPCHSDDPNVNGFTGPNGECVFEPVNEFGFGFKTNVKAQSIGGEEDCIEFKPPEPPSFCKPCATDDDCTGPKEADPNSSCQLPVIACVSITDFDGVEKKVCHLNGPPKDPFSCREFPNSPNPAIQCLGPPPPVDCNIGGGRFDKRCCGGGGFGPPGFGGFGFGPPPPGPGGFGGPGFFREANLSSRLAFQEAEDTTTEETTITEEPKAPICGDGVLDSGEACDDGNLSDGDGCSSLCQVETTVVVVEEPSTEEPSTEEPSTGGSGVDLSDPLEALCAALAEKGLIQDDPRCEPFIGKFGGEQPSGSQPTTPTTGGPGFGGQPGFGGGPKGMGGRPQPIDQCVRQIICSDVENNFGPGDFGTLRPETLDSAKLQCQEQSGGSTTDFPGGGATGGQFPGGGATGGQFPGGPGGFGDPFGGPGGFGGGPGPGGFGPGPSGPGGFGGPDIQSCIDSCGFDPACEEKCKLEAGTFGSNEFGSGGFGPPPPPGGNFGPGGFPPPGGSFGFGPQPPPPGGSFGTGSFVDCSKPEFAFAPECQGFGGQPPPPPDGGQPPPPPPQ